MTRQGYIGKEKDVENNLGDHGVRKYDYETGRFNSIDPLFEKYYGWSPYQYCMNNPVWAKDWDGREVRVFSERIPASTMSKGTGSNLMGFIAAMGSPRHTFMQVKTDKVNVILELGGPQNNSTVGTPIKTEVKEDNDIVKGRVWIKEHKVKEPNEKTEFEFENKILNSFEKTKDNLPKYVGYPGPNSNGFIQYLIESNGGKVDKVPGGYGQEITEPYKNKIENGDKKNEK